MKHPSQKQPNFTIGRLAKMADVNIETIRYYQRIGLIAEPQKPAQGFRTYTSATAEKIIFIKRAQQLGFSLTEVSDLLQLGSDNCKDIRIRAENKRNKIQRQITDLQSLQNTLDQLIHSCQTGSSTKRCPIVKALTHKD